ncbi:MAG: putative sugar O-methyltransferase [Tagaea sp.]|nr:putative sugar O-methyltransferase [Tagaea sp.]
MNAAEFAAAYARCAEFADSCDATKRNIADTWVHSIARKGARYPLGEMIRMRRPGSYVTLHINIFDYFVDETIADTEDPIVRALVAKGEPEIGLPMREIDVEGRKFSSVYLKHLTIAAGIVRSLEARGVARPTIMEVGGGQGLLLAALRAWYGDRLTAISVDIPETLFYQTFYLTAAHPNAALRFKPDTARVAPVDGGFTFVNAYAAESFDCRLDAFVNANSMQEMDADVANGYLALARRWTVPGGSLFFRNSYGHAIDSVADPSDYDFGDRFRLVDSDFGDFFTDSSATPFAAFEFQRLADDAPPQDPAALRLALRALWNGYASGLLAPRSVVSRAIHAGALAPDAPNALRAIKAALAADSEGAQSDIDWIDALADRPRIERARAARRGRPAGDARWRRLTALWNVQKEMAAAMRAGVPPNLRTSAGDSSVLLASDHWAAHFAAIAAALGDADFAVELLTARAGSRNPPWRLRFAWIARRAGLIALESEFLARVAASDLDPAWRPALAVALHRAGETAEAKRILDAAVAQAEDIETLRVAYRVSAALGLPEACATIEARMAKLDPARHATSRLALANALLAKIPTATAGFAPDLAAGEDSPAAVEFLARIGDRDGAVARAEARMTREWESYYSIGGLVRPLLIAGADGLAARCVDRSLALRREAIRHLEYLAGLCLDAERYAMATPLLAKIVARKPYDHVADGCLAFAAMPEGARRSGIYGSGEDLKVLFQTYQSFYYPEGPQIR